MHSIPMVQYQYITFLRRLNTYLNVGLGVYLMHSIPWGSPCLVVKVIALDKHTVFAHAADPHLSVILLIQNHAYEGGGRGRKWKRGRRMREDKTGEVVPGRVERKGDWVMRICELLPFPMCSLALSLASVRCTLESLPRQNRSPPDGST